MDPTTLYLTKKFYMIVTALVFVGGLNWLAVAVTGSDHLRSFLGFRVARWIYGLVGLATLTLMFRRDVYLPFLGETLIPDGALIAKSPQGANQSVTITTRPGAKVIFWAAEPDPNQDHGKNLKSWDVAYKGYENSGVAVADDRGNVLLRFRGPPQPYTVPMGTIEPHVHFRVAENDGMFGPVQIMYLKNGVIEGFSATI
jgi:uncharacterized membrane protein YuzA (DUF378 family)